MTQKLPIARSECVAVQELENETLIYDFEIDKAYCLNETSAVVYRHCDGITSFDELKRRYQYTDDLIFLALDELQKNNLIESEAITHFAGMSRREAIRRVGLGTLVSLPIVNALVAPTAASAASGCATDGQACTFNNYTQSDCCSTTQRCESDTGNTCVECIGSNGNYFDADVNASVEFCNSRPEKNRCCNTAGSATLSGSNCLCP